MITSIHFNHLKNKKIKNNLTYNQKQKLTLNTIAPIHFNHLNTQKHHACFQLITVKVDQNMYEQEEQKAHSTQIA